MRRVIWIGLILMGCSSFEAEEPLPNGAPCELAVDCQSQYCIPTERAGEPTSWPGGICTEPCGEDACGESLTCVTFDEGGLCMVDCTLGSDCRTGYVCHPELAVCLPDCRKTWDCGERFVCDQHTGACAFPMSPGAELGEACIDAFDCVSSICLAELDDEGTVTGWQDGMCTLPCLDGDCGADAVCTRLDDRLFCLPKCDVGSPCRDGYACSDVVSACFPDCRGEWACGNGFECRADGQCALITSPTAAFGEACAADYECETGICLPDQSGWPDGTCVGICGAETCGDASGCATLDGIAFCIPSCGTASCRDGYVCNTTTELCFPDCRLGFDCGSTFECSATTGTCESFEPISLPIGSNCSAASQCASSQCLLAPGSGFDAGLCTSVCTPDCPTSFVCADVGDGEYCLPVCGNCPAQYVCDSAQNACVPDCLSGWPCAAGETCRNNGLCRERSPGPGGPGR